MDVLRIIPLILHVISILLHTLGIYLLRQQTLNTSNQIPLLLNLSIAEIFMSVFDFTYNILQHSNVDKNTTEYFYTIQCTCFVISYFLILIVLTLDRFFEVYLNITYPVYFSRKIVSRCLAVCWIIGFTLCFLLVMLRYTINIDSLRVVFLILFPTFESIFFTVAVFTYGYIFKKYRKANLSQVKGGSNTSLQRRTFKRRKFFVPTLIIVTFFFFAIIPDQLHLFLFYLYDAGSNKALDAILTLYVIGFICDALIYIFFPKGNRTMLKKMFKPHRAVVHPTTTWSAETSSHH